MLLIKRLLDNSIKVGDGDTLSLVIKHMFVYFKELGATKYSIACFEFVAQQQIFLSEKMATLVRQERFVNNSGRKYTNIPIDLDVEHSNKHFKENFRLAQGELSQKVLDRLSKSQDVVVDILDTFRESFKLVNHTALRVMNEDKYKEDVNKIAKHLKCGNVFDVIPGRKVGSEQLKKAATDLFANIDRYKLMYWMIERLAVMQDEPFYKY